MERLIFYDENVKKDPEKMYILALKTRKELPEELHQAMMLWSFDSNCTYVKMYLDWIKHCQEIDLIRDKYNKKIEFGEKMVFLSLCMCGATIFLIILFQNLKIFMVK